MSRQKPLAPEVSEVKTGLLVLRDLLLEIVTRTFMFGDIIETSESFTYLCVVHYNIIRRIGGTPGITDSNKMTQ